MPAANSLNFANVNLKLVGNVEKPKEAKEEKKEEKSTLFTNTNVGSLFGPQPSAQISGDKKPSLFGASTTSTQPQANLFAQK